MNKNDNTAINTSIQTIFKEISNIYNNYKFNNLNTNEPFSVPSDDNNIKSTFIEIVIIAKNNGYEINFTIDELNDVLKYLELRANLLTSEQQEKRKKVFINIKNILIKFKESGKLDEFINNLINPILGSALESNFNPALEPNFNQALEPNFNGITNIQPQIVKFYTLLINIVDLYIEDINNINNNKYNMIIIITLIILLFIVIVFYFLKK
jgi:hypothetical protein